MSRVQNIDFELLRTFIAVVDHGSITRASKQIYRTQSAMSMQIKRLEEQIGQTLFDRSGRQLVLSYHGKSLVAYARRLLNLHDEAINKLTNKDHQTHLTIGCPFDYSESFLPKLIGVLHQSNPLLHISVITANSGELRRLMDAGTIDVALLTRLPQSNEGVLVYQAHGVWLAKEKSSFEQRPLPLVLVEPDCKFHSSVIDGLEKSHIDYQLLCDASQTHLLFALVRERNAVTVVPDVLVPNDLIGLSHVEHLPELPVAEVIISLKGGEQSIIGLSLQEIALRMK
ncbi:LysR family transcriptional regulator [Colwelliaceae bacterium 6441]